MTQTLQQDGTWSAATALSCEPTWILQTTLGDSCDVTCAAAGFACQDGDWGAGSEATLAAALEAAGVNTAARCSSYSGHHSDATPFVIDASTGRTDQCRYHSGVSDSTCSSTFSGFNRLCKCE